MSAAMRWQLRTRAPSDPALRALIQIGADMHRIMRACDGEVCLELVILLSGGERGVGELARMMSLELSAVSLRLGNMKRQGLVACRREGSRKFYALTPVVKVAVVGAFRVLTIRIDGGAEIRVAMPQKLMKEIEASWQSFPTRAVALPASASERPRPEVREVNVNELAARVRASAASGAVRVSGKVRQKK